MMLFLKYYLLRVFIVFFVLSMIRSAKISDSEERIIDYLFNQKAYNNLIRPVSNINNTLIVDLGLALIQIISVDEKNQIVVSNVWIRLEWTDFQLKWNPDDFGKLSVIRVPADKVWRPDIVLFNSADGNYEVSWKPNVLIHNDGRILWIPPAILKSSCAIDVTYFPYDEQICKLRFGSWNFDATQVSLNWYSGIQFVDLSDYWKSETWDLVSCPGEMKNYSNPGQLPTTEIVYQIHIRRKTLFYTFNLILPCVLIAFLTSCVFSLSTESGEKIPLCVNVLLALVVFLLLMSQILPPTSISVPLISKYLLFTFILNIIAVIFTVLIMNIHYRSPYIYNMPNWVRFWFMEIVPVILRMPRPVHVLNERARRNKKSPSSPNSWNENDNNLNGFLLSNHEENDEDESCNLNFITESETKKNLNEIFAAVNLIAANLQTEDNLNEAIHDWQYVAAVLDKMMLTIFLIVTTIGTFGILFNFESSTGNFNQDDVIKKFSSQSI